MPIYDYRCSHCKHEFERNLKVAQYQETQFCPECSLAADKTISRAPALGDPVKLGFIKPSDGFRDVLRNIHHRTPGSVLKNNSSYI